MLECVLFICFFLEKNPMSYTFYHELQVGKKWHFILYKITFVNLIDVEPKLTCLQKVRLQSTTQ